MGRSHSATMTATVTERTATPNRTTANRATWRCIRRPSMWTAELVQGTQALPVPDERTALRDECGQGHHADERAARTASRRAALRKGFSRNAAARASSETRRG